MSKWRAVLVGAMASGALAAGAFIPAFADTPAGPVVTDIGELHVHGTGPSDGSITADGAEDNPEPVDGSATLSGEGICTSDDGEATGTPSKDCNEQVILSQLP